MNTLIPLRGAPAATGRVPPPAANLWRDGALLEAIVRGRGPDNTTELQIGRHRVQARGGDGLRAGQSLTLKVSVTREQILLRPLSDRPAAQISDAVRQALPRQSGQPPLLANLALLASTAASGRALPPVTALARSLLGVLPDKNTVARPDGLQRAIRDSGVFFENRLAGQLASGERATLGTDWKAALLRAADALRSMPTRAATSAAPRTPADSPATPALPSRLATPVAAESGANPRPTGPPAMTAPPPPSPPPRVVLSPGSLPAATARPASAPAASIPGVLPLPPASGELRQVPSAGPIVARDAAAPPLRGVAPAAQPPSMPTLASGEPRAAIAELSAQVGGVLSRLSLSQLASVPTDPAGGNVWMLELPVRAAPDQTDVLHFRFEREAGSDPDSPDPWSVDLSFDFASTGPVQARITVRGGRVATMFWAQREATATALRAGLAQLQTQLEDCGLTVAGVGCRIGKAAAPPSQAGALLRTRA